MTPWTWHRCTLVLCGTEIFARQSDTTGGVMKWKTVLSGSKREVLA